MDAPEMFPGEREVREEVARAGWSPSIGNGRAAAFRLRPALYPVVILRALEQG